MDNWEVSCARNGLMSQISQNFNRLRGDLVDGSRSMVGNLMHHNS